MLVSLKRAAVGVGLMAVAGFLTVLALSAVNRPPTVAPSAAPAPAPSAPVASAAAPAASTQPEPPVERALKVRALGRLTAIISAPVTRVIFLISGEGGLTPADTDRAKSIGAGSAVVLVSFDALKKAQGAVRCWFPAGVLEDLAKDAEGQLDLAAYHAPALVGIGAGASLAYAALAQAPEGTFAGAVGIGFNSSLPTNRPLCSTRTWKPVFDETRHVEKLPPADPKLAWQDLGPVASGGPRLSASLDALFASSERVTAKPAPPTASATELERRLGALKLSLDDTWAEHPKASLIFLSGDGGWRDIDQHLAAYLAPRGVNVVGLSSMAYLWKAKTPQQGGADLRRMADIAADANVPLFVGGYSIGAEVAPFFLDAWPEADRQKVSGQILIAPSPTATFEISISAMDWNPFHKEKVTPFRVADAIRRIQLPTLCVTGGQVTAANTPCAAVEDIATVVRLPGDHHFNGNYDAVGKASLAFIEKRLIR